MKLADSNIWMALAIKGHGQNAAAHRWFDEQTASSQVYFCRATQMTFLRLLTTKSVMEGFGSSPLSNLESWGVYSKFQGDSRVGFAVESSNLDVGWHKFSARESVSPKVWMDAYLAAFAIAGGYRLVTFDRAFREFKGLDLELLEP